MSNTTYFALKAVNTDKEADAADKLGGQPKIIVDTIVNKVGIENGIDRDDVIAELEALGTLNTVQPVNRVVGYYQSRLVDKGFLRLEVDTPDPSEVKAKKSRKSKKDAGKVEVPAEDTTETEADEAAG